MKTALSNLLRKHSLVATLCVILAIIIVWIINSVVFKPNSPDNATSKPDKAEPQAKALPTTNEERNKGDGSTTPHHPAPRRDGSIHVDPAPKNVPLAVSGQPSNKELNTEEAPYSELEITIRDKNIIVDPLLISQIALKPRVAHPPIPLRQPKGQKFQLMVKFMDQTMARSTGDNQIDLSEAKVEEVNELVTLARKHELVFTPTFNEPENIDELRIRAALNSKQMQADLNGTMTVVISDPESLLGIAETLQSMNIIESVDIESTDEPVPPPADIAPTTPDLESTQGYLNNNPGFGVDSLKALGATGKGIRYSDCEYGYNPAHEDLVDGNLTNSSRAAISSSVYTKGWDDHGTAAVGITMSQDNGYGTTGIAPECEGHFYSEWTTQGYSRSSAVRDAISNSRAGDVILLEMQTTGDTGYAPAEYSSTIWNLCKTATDSGIIVVAAAGNGSQDLDSDFYEPYRNRGDSGAIIIGAGSNTTAHSRLSFSTYGSRVDVQAWGTGVMTSGYGSYAKYGDDENQAYTSTFNGTSSASACAAGAVVLLQSYAKNKLDTLFTPAEMRAYLKTHGHAQTGSSRSIGPAISLDQAASGLPVNPMQMDEPTVNGDDLTLSFWGLPFRTYEIQYSQDLSTWHDLLINISGSNEKVNSLLEDEIKNHPKRFYRVKKE